MGGQNLMYTFAIVDHIHSKSIHLILTTLATEKVYIFSGLHFISIEYALIKFDPIFRRYTEKKTSWRRN